MIVFGLDILAEFVESPIDVLFFAGEKDPTRAGMKSAAIFLQPGGVSVSGSTLIETRKASFPKRSPSASCTFSKFRFIGGQTLVQVVKKVLITTTLFFSTSL